VGILGTSAGTEPIVPDYLRGQVFNREVKEPEDLYYWSPKLGLQFAGLSKPLFATNQQLSYISDAENLLTNPTLDIIPVPNSNAGLKYGIGDPFANLIYYRLGGEYLDKKKAVENVFAVYGFRYLLYTTVYRGLTEVQYYRPIAPPPPLVELQVRLSLITRQKNKSFRFKRDLMVITGNALQGWQLYEYPLSDPVYGGGWYYYNNAIVAIELDVVTGAVRQVPRAI
jgi:hypothetical protein